MAGQFYIHLDSIRRIILPSNLPYRKGAPPLATQSSRSLVLSSDVTRSSRGLGKTRALFPLGSIRK